MKSKMEMSKEALYKKAISSDEVVRQRREEAEERAKEIEEIEEVRNHNAVQYIIQHPLVYKVH